MSLERLFYSILKSNLSDFLIEHGILGDMFTNFYKNENRMGEYFSGLKYVNDYNKFGIWFSSTNKIDNRIMKLSINDLTIVKYIKNEFVFDKVVSLDDVKFPININLDIIDAEDTTNIIYNKNVILHNKHDVKLLEACGTYTHLNQPILPDPDPKFYDIELG